MGRNIFTGSPDQTSFAASLAGKVEMGTSTYGATLAVAKQPAADARRTCTI